VKSSSSLEAATRLHVANQRWRSLFNERATWRRQPLSASNGDSHAELGSRFRQAIQPTTMKTGSGRRHVKTDAIDPTETFGPRATSDDAEPAVSRGQPSKGAAQECRGILFYRCSVGHQHLLGGPCEDAFQRVTRDAAVGKGDTKLARH
jgi:hypothetical protein